MANHATAPPYADDAGQPLIVRHRYIGGPHRGRHEDPRQPPLRLVAHVFGGVGLTIVALSTAWAVLLAATPQPVRVVPLPPAGQAGWSVAPAPQQPLPVDGRSAGARSSRSGRITPPPPRVVASSVAPPVAGANDVASPVAPPASTPGPVDAPPPSASPCPPPIPTPPAAQTVDPQTSPPTLPLPRSRRHHAKNLRP